MSRRYDVGISKLKKQNNKFMFDIVMFQWKTKFPKRPSPPSLEQQKEDLKNSNRTDILFTTLSIKDGTQIK